MAVVRGDAGGSLGSEGRGMSRPTDELQYYHTFAFVWLVGLAITCIALFSKRGQYLEGASFFCFAVFVVRYVLSTSPVE